MYAFHADALQGNHIGSSHYSILGEFRCKKTAVGSRDFSAIHCFFQRLPTGWQINGDSTLAACHKMDFNHWYSSDIG